MSLIVLILTACGGNETATVDETSNMPAERTVLAAESWQGMDIPISSGQYVSITYLSGEWTAWEHYGFYGADGGRSSGCHGDHCVEPVTDFPQGALIGRIGDSGTPFPVGNETDFTADESGLLYLRINDGEDGLSDNTGAVTVEVIVE